MHLVCTCPRRRDFMPRCSRYGTSLNTLHLSHWSCSDWLCCVLPIIALSKWRDQTEQVEHRIDSAKKQRFSSWRVWFYNTISIIQNTAKQYARNLNFLAIFVFYFYWQMCCSVLCQSHIFLLIRIIGQDISVALQCFSMIVCCRAVQLTEM